MLAETANVFLGRSFDEDIDHLKSAFGSTSALLEKLKTDEKTGLTCDDLLKRADYFGTNKPNEPEQKSLASMISSHFLGSWRSLLSLILLAGCVVSIVTRLVLGESALPVSWQESCFILCIYVVVLVMLVKQERNKAAEALQQNKPIVEFE